MLSLKKLALVLLMAIPGLANAALLEYSDALTDVGDDLLLGEVSFTVVSENEVTVSLVTGTFTSGLWIFDDSDGVVDWQVGSIFGGPVSQQTLAAGNYTAVIGPSTTTEAIALAGIWEDRNCTNFVNPSFSSCGWTLSINGDVAPVSPIPVPAALPLFMSALAGLSLLRRKQK